MPRQKLGADLLGKAWRCKDGVIRWAFAQTPSTRNLHIYWLAEDVQVWQQGGMRDPRTWLTAVDAPETEYQAPQPGERFKVGGMGGPIVYEQTPAGEPWKYIGYASLVEPKP